MKISDVVARRRRNLRLLVDQKFNGVDKRLADHCGMSPSYLHRLFAPTDTERSRSLFDDKAAEIERRCDLPAGWLDRDHTPGLQTELDDSGHWALVLEPREAFDYIVRHQMPENPTKWPVGAGVASDESIWLVVRGEQMMRPSGTGLSFLDGTMVLIDPNVGPIDGSLVGVCFENNAPMVLRQYKVRDTGQAYLEAFNPGPGEEAALVGSSTTISGVVVSVNFKVDLKGRLTTE